MIYLIYFGLSNMCEVSGLCVLEHFLEAGPSRREPSISAPHAPHYPVHFCTPMALLATLAFWGASFVFVWLTGLLPS